VERDGGLTAGPDQKVAALRSPQMYPDNPDSVDIIETHKSWVFLTDIFAYKLKRPVQFDSVDFRSVEARCRDCETEVRLNRRLAGDIYLGVEELRLSEAGDLTFSGSGTLVDCLVKMKRLPADRMLSNLILEQRLREDEVRAVALKLSRFYAESPPVLTDTDQYMQHLESEIRASMSALSTPAVNLPVAIIRDLTEAQLRMLVREPNLLDRRVEECRIVDGHGDLRPEHVCVLPDPVIFDCLEFNDRLRKVDPVDELCFLALDCERIGNASVGPVLFSVYEEVTGDSAPSELIAFYTMYRACMWARLAIWRTRELESAAWTKWTSRANAYLKIAESQLATISPES
jgi:uncharacterized protein